MSAIVFAPHGDDETLFAAFACMRERAHVVVCSQDADIAVRRMRSLETTRAIEILGCSHHEWQMPADRMNWDKAREWMEAWNSTALVASVPDRVYAPAYHPEGHEQHNQIAELVAKVFGEDRVTYYSTYAPRGQRQRMGIEFQPTPDEISRKLAAIACYRTQIEHPSTRPWFYDLLDLREWYYPWLNAPSS